MRQKCARQMLYYYLAAHRLFYIYIYFDLKLYFVMSSITRKHAKHALYLLIQAVFIYRNAARDDKNMQKQRTISLEYS